MTPDNTQRIAIMQARLTEALHPTHLEIIDDSHLHVGHAGAKGGAGHFTVKIASDAFAGQSRIACHQLVYAAVGDLIPHEVHALAIKVV